MAKKFSKLAYDQDYFIIFVKEPAEKKKIQDFLTELKCPPNYKRIYDWPADFLSVSLNSDQLASAHIELLETLITHPKRIRTLLAPSDLMLEKWTKKKKTDIGTTIEKAEEKTQAFKYLGDSDPILIIRFDNVIDQNRNIRKQINALLSSKEKYEQALNLQTFFEFEVPSGGDLTTVHEDEGELPEAYKIGNTAVEKLERTYYPSQIFLANQIVDRIKAIYSHYHKDKPFSSFKNFDFCIYTANIKMLEDQTCLRLSRRESECFPDRFYEGSDCKAREEARNKVFRYNTSTVDKKHQKLLNDITTKQNTLFLIVADEAHWGATTEDQANSKLINTWNSEEHPNVIVLQVTATPYNLLTENTRVPIMAYYKAESNGNYTVEDKENTRGQGIPEDFRQLHRVKWTESSESKIKKGIIVRLKIPLVDPVQLCMKCPTSNNDSLAWHGKLMTESCADYSEFLIQGPKNQVTISTLDRKWVLVAKDHEVAFVYKERREIGISKFGIMDCYGEGLIVIKCQVNRRTEQLLVYNDENNRIELHRRTLQSSGEYDVPKLSTSFLIEQCRPINSIGPVKEYLSLTYYFNSMRNKEVKNQLIRQDLSLEAMAEKVKKSKGTMKIEIDDILTAEYSYYIIVTNLYRTLSLGHTSMRNCLENLDKYIGAYSMEREEYINKFMEELEKPPEDICPINTTIFTNFLSYFSEKVSQEFQEKFQSFQTEPNQITAIELIHSLLSCLLHLSTDSLRDIKEKLPRDMRNNLLEEIQQFADSKLESVMKEIVLASETGCIVDTLIPKDHTMQGGAMIILRTNKQQTGNRMYKTLCIARKISNTLDYSFEILRDYSTASLTDDFDDKLESDQRERKARYRIRERMQPKKCTFTDSETNTTCHCVFGANEKLELLKPSMKCLRCNHVHKRIEKYEDLEGLPCILILIQKGRLGDTFPKSLRVLDSRVCHTKQMGPINLASVVQEMGRLCRYQIKCNDVPLPYALIGKHLGDTLSKALKMGAPFHAVIEIPGVQLDRKTLYKKRRSKDLLMEESATFTKTIHIPKKGHYDEHNAEKHKNRILLGAEPQIGKTGVYLKVISILQQHFSWELEDETDDETEDDTAEAAEDETEGKDDKNHWVYPYWKHNEETSSLVKTVTEGRYPNLYGIYQHGGPAPEIIPRSIFNQTPGNNKRCVKRVLDDNKIKSFNFREHGSCVECFVQYESDVFELYLPHAGTTEDICELINFKISVPKTLQYHTLLEHIKPHVSNMATLSSENLNVSIDEYLNSWIFIPSHKRSDRANVNLYHTMVTKKLGSYEPCQYIAILVVRSTDFQSYCKLWQSTHAVLQIPDTLPDVDRDVYSGGIGFARLAIQIFAEHLKLEWIFMLDDNMPHLYEVEETDLAVKRENGTLVEKTVPLFKVLKHIEKQVDGSEKRFPLDDFEKYSTYTNEHVRHPLEDYTGISGKYGIIGIKKYRPTIRKVRRPFSKTHVHSLLFLNITALTEKRIYYKPWQVFEDLTINNDCDDKGLWVCKYNRFTTWKRHMKTWIPNVYKWSKDTVLTEGLRDIQNSSEILIKYLKCECTIKNVIELPDKGAEAVKTELDHFIENVNKKNGKYPLFVVRGHNFKTATNELESIIRDQKYFTKGQNYFVILMSTAFCINEGMTTKSSFDKWLQNMIQHHFEFEIVTSHKVGEFSVKILLAIVRVNIPHGHKDDVLRKKQSSRSKNSTRTQDSEKQESSPKKKLRISENDVPSTSGTQGGQMQLMDGLEASTSGTQGGQMQLMDGLEASTSGTQGGKMQLMDDLEALLQQYRLDPSKVNVSALLECKEALTRGHSMD